MKTISEHLSSEENQQVIRERIINALRSRWEWGKYGLFSKIAEHIGFSASYVSKSLTGKKPLRENFVERMAEYLGLPVDQLLQRQPSPDVDFEDRYTELVKKLQGLVDTLKLESTISWSECQMDGYDNAAKWLQKIIDEAKAE